MGLFIIYPTEKLPNVVKISAKINTMQNIKILLFVCSLSLTRFAVKHGRPIDRQASTQ